MYSEQIADQICARLAEGESLNAICKDPDMPAESTVRAWAKDDVSGFAAKYTRAREIGYERLADEILQISDEVEFEPVPGQDGGEPREVRVDSTAVARNRLRVDTRKWMLSKMLPKMYGDRQVIAGDPEAPLQHAHTLGLSSETARFLAELSKG